MSTSATDMAVFEAIKTTWVAAGLNAVVPNGIFWGEATRTTLTPYALFDVIGVAGTGMSNRSAYRNYSFQFKIVHTSQANAGYLMDQVINALEDTPVALAAGQGRVFRASRGSLRFVRHDETRWACMVDLTLGRNVPRTRPSHS